MPYNIWHSNSDPLVYPTTFGIQTTICGSQTNMFWSTPLPPPKKKREKDGSPFCCNAGVWGLWRRPRQSVDSCPGHPSLEVFARRGSRSEYKRRKGNVVSQPRFLSFGPWVDSRHGLEHRISQPGCPQWPFFLFLVGFGPNSPKKDAQWIPRPVDSPPPFFWASRPLKTQLTEKGCP